MKCEQVSPFMGLAGIKEVKAPATFCAQTHLRQIGVAILNPDYKTAKLMRWR
jgi:hypothetical protein